VVGDRGLRYMRNLIDAEKDKIRDKRKRDRYWSNWIERTVKPAERQIAKMTRVYLKDAAKRYAERVQGYVMESRSVGADYQRAIVDMGTLLGIADEVRIIDRTIGRTWRAVWTLQGNDVLDSIYDQLGETRPLDLVFGSRDLAAQLSQRSAQQIAESTGRSVLSVVERGLLEGLSVDQIAEQVQGATFFNANRARRIAQTESTRAVNAASLQAYREAANLGIQLKKEWISSRDDRTRPEHLELDGQNIGIDQPFEIGGYQGMSPGEFGVGSMDVNCRCTIAPIVVR
jgi:SPP1 gp7 family putative phage head morphogenesis protein